MQCKKCDYETAEKYYNDNGNEFLADHYCYDNKYYNSETEEYEKDDIVVKNKLKKKSIFDEIKVDMDNFFTEIDRIIDKGV